MDPKYETEIIVKDVSWRQKKQLITHERMKLTPAGEYAKNLIYAMSTGAVPYGETATGYPLARVLSSQEVVDRAMELTRLSFAAFERENMVVFLPTQSVFDTGDDQKVGF